MRRYVEERRCPRCGGVPVPTRCYWHLREETCAGCVDGCFCLGTQEYKEGTIFQPPPRVAEYEYQKPEYLEYVAAVEALEQFVDCRATNIQLVERVREARQKLTKGFRSR